MKKLLFIFQIVFILGLSPKTFTQTYAIKISTPEDELARDIIEDQNSGLYALIWRGVYNPDITPTTLYFDYRNLIYNIDPYGNLLDSLEIDTLDGYDLALWDFVKVGDSLLVWGNAYNLENADVHLALLWLDFNLRIIHLNLYGNYTDTVEFIQCIPVDDGNMVFAGGNILTNELILVKTSAKGTFIKEGTFEGMGSPLPNIGYIPATDKIICGRWDWLGYINNDDFTIDTIYYPLKFHLMSFSYFKTFDNTQCILPTQYRKIPPEYGSIFGCMLIDAMAQNTDSVIFEMAPELNMEREVDFLTTDTLFLGGVYNSYLEPPDYGFDRQDRKFALFKFNFENGLFWQNLYGDHANYVLTDITATSDGGCAMLGTYYDWRNNPVWERDAVIYKVDNEGLLTNIPENKNEGIKIFPNPASGHITIISSGEQLRDSEQTTVRLYDISGRKIFEAKGGTDKEININVADYPRGIYLFSLTTGNDFIFNQKVVVR
jgi:hypothetical protein